MALLAVGLLAWGGARAGALEIVAREPAPVQQPLLVPDSVQSLDRRCSLAMPPRSIALLVGVGDYTQVLNSLVGPSNDVAMMGSALRRLGAEVFTLSGRVVLQDFVQRMRSISADLRCGDTFTFHFSDHGNLLSDRAVALLFSDAEITNARDMAVRSKPARWPEGLGNVGEERQVGPGLVDSDELAVLFNALRANRVNINLMLDTHTPPALASALSGRRSAQGHWEWRPWDERLAEDDNSGRELGAFFAMLAPRLALEASLPRGRPESERQTYGMWTYAVASALLAEAPGAPFRAVAEATQRNYQQLDDQRGRGRERGPVFLATHPNRPPLAPGLVSQAPATPTMRSVPARRIEIINPKVVTRGAVPVSATSVMLEGRVIAQSLPRTVEANQNVARLNPDGSFSVRLPLVRGENRVSVVAWFEGEDFLPTTLTLLGTTDTGIAPLGRRYALVIGNRRYSDPAFAPLVTPHDDARRVARLLKERYGFEVELRAANAQAPTTLLLLDARREQIKRTLSALRRALQPEDTLLVYFAGHGIYEKATGQAYWLPVDAEKDEPESWYSAHDIQAAIQRLQARHVLVIADSCFSGALMTQRGDGLAAEPPAQREHFLAQTMLRNSRRFISSGANEPVQDGGGDGHSVFARALIDALSREDKPFTATELFTRHLVPRASGQATQLPQQFPKREGHDGGDLVFFPITARAQLHP